MYLLIYRVFKYDFYIVFSTFFGKYFLSSDRICLQEFLSLALLLTPIFFRIPEMLLYTVSYSRDSRALMYCI